VSDSGTSEGGRRPAQPAGKGRPTPKRSEKERRRGAPAAPPPQTRKEAARRQKEQARQARSQTREGVARGDDRYLPKRDAGPVRRLVRDLVDSRRSAAVLVLPIALFLVVAQIAAVPWLLDVALTLWLAGLLVVLVDLVALGMRIRSRLRREFPEEQRTRGHVTYGLLRSTVFRRLRMPAPTVSPGTRV
jgi:membrane glycosyltransferase